MKDSNWFLKVQVMFGASPAHAELDSVGNLLDGEQEVFPYLAENGRLADWPASQTTLRQVLDGTPRASRTHNGAEPDQPFADRQRDKLYADMLRLVEAAHPNRKIDPAGATETVEDLRLAMSAECRKSLQRLKPSTFVGIESRKVARQMTTRPDTSAKATKLFRLLLSQPAWWALLPRKWRNVRLRMLAERRGLFDGAGYLRRYPDVAQSNIDPLQHYLTFGFSEHRSTGD